MSTFAKRVALAAFVGLACLTTTASAQKTATAKPARPEVGELAEAYAGDKNLVVTIVRVGKRENKQALVEIVGLDHPWNRRIFKANVANIAPNSSSIVKNEYTIKVNGGDWNLARTEDNQLTLFLRENGATGKSQEYRLGFAKSISDDTRPEYLLTAYLKQEADPKISTKNIAGKAK